MPERDRERDVVFETQAVPIATTTSGIVFGGYEFVKMNSYTPTTK